MRRFQAAAAMAAAMAAACATNACRSGEDATSSTGARSQSTTATAAPEPDFCKATLTPARSKDLLSFSFTIRRYNELVDLQQATVTATVPSGGLVLPGVGAAAIAEEHAWTVNFPSLGGGHVARFDYVEGGPFAPAAPPVFDADFDLVVAAETTSGGAPIADDYDLKLTLPKVPPLGGATDEEEYLSIGTFAPSQAAAFALRDAVWLDGPVADAALDKVVPHVVLHAAGTFTLKRLTTRVAVTPSPGTWPSDAAFTPAPDLSVASFPANTTSWLSDMAAAPAAGLEPGHSVILLLAVDLYGHQDPIQHVFWVKAP